MSLINREALYEKACGLEAQALSYVGKIANDETKIEEWRIWSAILAERTAFKHDIFDAPEVKPEPKWIPVSEKAHPTKEGKYLVTDDAGGMATVEVDDFIYCDDGSGMWLCSQNVTAWKPRPEPYREEGAE